MIQFFTEGHKLCDGYTRREWLRLGGVALGGLALPELLAHRNVNATNRRSSAGRAKSVILFGLVGGPPQHETWDPKPSAPAEIRGEFGNIATRTTGLRVCELMPKTARLTDKIAVLRAVVTGDNAHSSSGYQMLTGVPHQPLNRESALPKPPNNWPSMGAIVRALRFNPGQLPSAVTLPEHIWNDGNFPWPGQDAGFLGRRCNPWLIHCDPSAATFAPPGLSLPADVSPARLFARRSLLQQVNNRLDAANRSAAVAGFGVHVQQALDLVSGAGARNAFHLDKEPARVRDRYGRSRFAQSVLLARRLVEAGVSLVQINWTRIVGQENQGGWDTHKKNNQCLKNLLMPIMDRAFSALIEDLEVRGLLDETLVVWLGEFGRTPRFNRNAGRDHWGHVFSLALAGGGIRGGQFYGASDRNGAYPIDGIVRPKDLIATVFHCLGYGPDTIIRDTQNRPLAISQGRVIQALV